jgi:alkylated DNA nucleotide flippase Atl1
MLKTRSWWSKLEDAKDLPKVVKIPPRMRARWGSGTLVIPAPLEVDSIMKRVPRGKLITVNEIRVRLARKHGATIGCPMTTGIFAWIVANAAKEAEDNGKKRFTPYWRTLKSGGEINPKYPGGIEAQSRLLVQEGHTVTRRGSRAFVDDYADRLVAER